MKRAYAFFGGRKMFLGYFAVGVLTIGAWWLDGDFGTWATWVVTSLGLGMGTTAWEDSGKHRANAPYGGEELP